MQRGEQKLTQRREMVAAHTATDARELLLDLGDDDVIAHCPACLAGIRGNATQCIDRGELTSDFSAVGTTICANCSLDLMVSVVSYPHPTIHIHPKLSTS